MKFFPGSALIQLEFDKVKTLLAGYCQAEWAKEKAANLRIHTKKEFIERELQQPCEMQVAVHDSFPGTFTKNISKELKLLAIPGAVLAGEQLLQVKSLAEASETVFRWFNTERRDRYPALTTVIAESWYEKQIVQSINEVVDDNGNVHDNASEGLGNIRMALYRKRNELRRLFDKIASKLTKNGYLADIEESFMNGRRVLAVYAENKRMVKGVLHGESDSRRTSFIEPEETTTLNNEIFSLEHEESREVYRILKKLTELLSHYAPLLKQWYIIAGEFDFINAKYLFAKEYNGIMPLVEDKPHVDLINAFHPLLYLYNKTNKKTTIPVTLTLNEKNRILVISGPNAGGKTVTMKTIGLLQLMLQSGLLVPVGAGSNMGIFKQVMIHIGDTQSLEFELSTYSSHLKNMKHFMENANGRTLFFIDELGSGSDPSLGGAFAEVIMEELAHKHSVGVVTTHYLNLKVMANKVAGIINGAMQFDEKNLLPLYKLIVGKPGSSYTFSIAERIGLDKKLIVKARQLVDNDHFTLDKLLNRTEQDLQKIDKEKKELQALLKENKKLKDEMQQLMDKEKHRQEIERLRHTNKLNEEKLAYLKDMDRKLKAMVMEWRRAEDKTEAVKMIAAVLFKQKEKQVTEKHQKKLAEKFEEISGDIQPGIKVKMNKNRQVGTVKEIRGKKAVVQLGAVPITVDLTELTPVKEIEKPG